MATESLHKYEFEEALAGGRDWELLSGKHIISSNPPVSVSILALKVSGSDSLDLEKIAGLSNSYSQATLKLIDVVNDGGTQTAIFEDFPSTALSKILETGEQRDFSFSISLIKEIARALDLVKAEVNQPITEQQVLVSSKDALGLIEPPAIRLVFPLQKHEISGADDASTDKAVFENPEQENIRRLGLWLYKLLIGFVPEAIQRPENSLELPPPITALRKDLPDGVSELLLKAVSINEEFRFGSYQDFINELEAVESHALTEAAVKTEKAKSYGWQTAAMMLLGLALFAAALIYATRDSKTQPAAQDKTQAGEIKPVQPLAPATGLTEQELAKLPPDANILTPNAADTSLPGGDGYDPWANGGVPPPGAPKIPPGGKIITIPDGQSPFMQDQGCIPQPSGILLCPVPVTPTPTRTPKATPTPAASPSAGDKQPQKEPTPAAQPTPQASPKQKKSPQPNQNNEPGEPE